MFHLSHKSLVLQQPGLPHGGLSVEPPRHLLQLLLSDQLVSQDTLAVVLRPLQALPGLQTGDETYQGGV